MPQVIYMITNILNGKKYIGQTSKTVDSRWAQHVRCANSAQSTTMLIARAVKKYGKERFKIETLKTFEENTPQEIVDQTEIQYIASFNSLKPNGYNLALGGKCVRHSDDTKEKNRRIQIKHWNSLSEEERQKKLDKMRTERNKIGTNFTREGLQRKKDYQKERWINDGQYKSAMEANLVKARKAAHTPEAEKKKGQSLVKNRLYKLTSPTGEVFEVQGLHQFAKQHNLDTSGLQKVAKGKLKHYKQWKCECLNDSGIRTEKPNAYLKLKRYLLTNPKGVQFCTYGLEHLKGEHSLTPTHLRKVASNKLLHHKQWKCENCSPSVTEPTA